MSAVRPNVMTFGVRAFLDAFTLSLPTRGPGGFMFAQAGARAFARGAQSVAQMLRYAETLMLSIGGFHKWGTPMAGL